MSWGTQLFFSYGVLSLTASANKHDKSYIPTHSSQLLIYTERTESLVQNSILLMERLYFKPFSFYYFAGMGGMTGFTSSRPPTSAAGGASTSSSFGNFTMPSASNSSGPSRGTGGGSNPSGGFAITQNDLAQALALAGMHF